MKKFFIGIFLVAMVISQAVVGYAMTDREKEAQKYFEQANEEWKKGIRDRDEQLVLKLYNRAIELNPNLSDAYIGRSVLYYLGYDRNLDFGKNDLERALQVNPNSARAYRWRAYLNYYGNFDDTNKLNRALSDVNKAIEIDPNYLDAYELRADIYKWLENYEKAVEDYTYILEYPDLRNSSYMKYYDFDRTIDWDWAWYDGWDQRIAYLYYERSYIYYPATGDIDKAIADSERALQLSPENNYIRNRLNRCIAERDRQNAS